MAYRFLPAEYVIYFASMTITVLLADDSEIIRKGIASLLKGDPEIELVGERVGFAQTIRLAANLRPQVIVLDVHMSDEHTLTQAQLKSGLKGSRLLALSVWNDDETKYCAKAIGAAAKAKHGANWPRPNRHHLNYASCRSWRSLARHAGGYRPPNRNTSPAERRKLFCVADEPLPFANRVTK